MHTTLTASPTKAKHLKAGDKFSIIQGQKDSDTMLSGSREQRSVVFARRLTDPLHLTLGVPHKSWGNAWIRTDTPCPDELAERGVYLLVEMGLVKACDLKPGDLFRPQFPMIYVAPEKLAENPLLSLGVAAEGLANTWIRTTVPCPDELAEKYVLVPLEEKT